MSKAIEMQKVSFKYAGYATKVLYDVDFEINYGELVLISGASGSGKSTLFSMINGVIPNIINGAVSGSIYIDGQDASTMQMGQISRLVGSVLQNADSQIIQAVVKDEIAFGCENFAIPPAEITVRIDESCKAMELDKDLPTRTLSGGQKQRLITATTLAMGQRIIILDEPLANLDTEGSDQLMQLLKELVNKGFAVIIVEHRLDRVIDYVDSVWDMREGVLTRIEDKREYLISQSALIQDTSTYVGKGDILFSTQDIHYKVKKRVILRGASFDINRGERLVVLGENGCGKTTLLKVVTRLLKPTSGQVRQYLDPKFKSKRSGTREWYSKVGVVYQNPNYQLFMDTVDKEIRFNGYDWDYCQRMVDLFDIGDLLERHPQSLSEGQKRKVSIAAVMATRPEVLILDEPTVGQDYNGLKNMVDIINKLHNEFGTTIITITHDVRCAESLCDKAIIVEKGIVREQGGKELVRRYLDDGIGAKLEERRCGNDR